MENDSYKTLQKPTEEVRFTLRGSKFYGYAFPLLREDEAGNLLDQLADRYRRATHLCYAWQWGVHQPCFRIQDDGEPTHSAGMPIYGQIQACGLTNVLVAVIRIFGGTKLGIGGLIQAYRTTSKMALESGIVITKTLHQEYELFFDYSSLDRVLKLIKHWNIAILSQDLQMRCILKIGVRLKLSRTIKSLFEDLPGVVIQEVGS